MLLLNNFIYKKFDVSQTYSFKEQELIKKIASSGKIKIINNGKKNFLEFNLNNNLIAISYKELLARDTISKKIITIEKKATAEEKPVFLNIIDDYLNNQDKLEQLNILGEAEENLIARLIFTSIETEVLEFFLKENGDFYLNLGYNNFGEKFNYPDFDFTEEENRSNNILHYNGSTISIILNLENFDFANEETINEILIATAEQLGRFADFTLNENGKINGRYSSDFKFLKPNEELEKFLEDDLVEILSLFSILEQNKTFRSLLDREYNQKVKRNFDEPSSVTKFKNFRNNNIISGFLDECDSYGFSFMRNFYYNYSPKDEFFINLHDSLSEIIFFVFKKISLQDFAENEAKYNHALAVRLHNALSLLPALRIKWGEDVVKYFFKHLYLFYKTKMIKKLDTSYNIKPANE
jgi:hypothetical protein